MAHRSEKRQVSRETSVLPMSPRPANHTKTTSAVALKQAILDNLWHVQGKVPELATKNDWYMAVAYTVRDRMIEHFIR